MFYIENILVHPDHRRQGTGTLLFQAFIEASQQADMRLVKWEVEGENEAGVGFFKAMDAELDPQWWTCFISLEDREMVVPSVVEGFRSRLATDADAEDIRDLVMELAVYEKAPNEVLSQIVEYQDAIRNGDISVILIVDDAESVVGMALFHDCFVKEGKALYLEDFVVVEAHRRKGLGRMIFDHLIQEAISRGSKRLLWQVLEWNVNAISFYDKYGARYIKGRYNGKIYNNTH
eukprot:TRINITY_DN2782_c1_g2_i1.p1 TRINITY_DN2782_c1_g2~~TRINITY_DN2782_c1_g2_i1.p1  ORF type:complete len:233 (-),score=44.03 TRINITY_DN2782_c1_g2_i1:8-706(-)